MLCERKAGKIIESWIDYNGHLTEPRYYDAMMDPINDWFDLIEVGEAYLKEDNYSMFTLPSHHRNYRTNDALPHPPPNGDVLPANASMPDLTPLL